MARLVRFNWWRGLKPGHSLPTPPHGFTWVRGQTRLFNRALAAEHGRLCTDPACDGDCWALLFAATWNAAHEALPDAEKPFTLHDPADVDAAMPLSDPVSDPVDPLAGATGTTEIHPPPEHPARVDDESTSPRDAADQGDNDGT